MKKLHIALMTHTIDNRRGMGTAIVARETVERLIQDERFEVTLVHYDRVDDALYARAREMVMPYLPRLPFGTRFFRFLLFCWKYRKDQFDLVHWFQPRLYPFFWLFPARHIVVTAHGGGDALAPQKFSLSKKMFVFVLRHFHRYIDAVIASSQCGKREILEAYTIPESKIHIIYLGGSETYRPIDRTVARERMRERYGIHRPYILTVSRLVPHKNVEGLIRAYARMRGTLQTPSAPLLVVVGGKGGWQEVIYREKDNSSYRDDIVFIDYVAPEDLNAAYAGAELFVFPSLNEGWGMPVIEAFSSGIPVVATNLTAVPEAAGDAALLVDPRDENALAKAMAEVLADASLRERMVERGLAQAARFTWGAMVQGIISVYKQVLQ